MTVEPNHYHNIVALLAARAESHPDRLAVRMVQDRGRDGVDMTYGQLHRDACALAGRLREEAEVGARALLLYPSGPAYVTSFIACLYAGITAVPAYPPAMAAPSHGKRIEGIERDARPSLLLTCGSAREAVEKWRKAQGEVGTDARLVVTDDDAGGTARPVCEAGVTADSLAFLQYTSGSTTAPKGVMVTHGNLWANEQVIRNAFALEACDVVVSWLPLFHDMGLIGGLLQPLFSGATLVLMTPQAFIRRPLFWLEIIARHGGTVSGGPNFAYRLCAEALAAAAPGLDLSSWRLSFCGAEPVRADTLTAFAERSAGHGFRARALYPCYGLAEATLLVSGGRPLSGMRSQTYATTELAQGRALVEAQGRRLVACGTAQPEHEVVIVDPTTGLPQADCVIGEVQVAGGSVAAGYWNNPGATEEAFVERAGRRYLRTGDLGFVAEGELYLTGRIKDVIVIRGQNLYPQDIEQCVDRELQLAYQGRVVAFSVTDAGGSADEALGVALEVGTRIRRFVDPDQVCALVCEAVLSAFQETPAVVLLVKAGGLPLTSSGKVMRSACRAAVSDGTFPAFYRYADGRGQPIPAPPPVLETARRD